jgi:hypothetical protein
MVRIGIKASLSTLFKNAWAAAAQINRIVETSIFPH